MAQDVAEKTEAPTLHRRQEARREGNVPRSAELSAAAIGVGAVLLLQHSGTRLALAMQTLLADGLSLSHAGGMGRAMWLIGTSVAPLLGGMIVIAIAINLLLSGWVFHFRTDNSALNPAKGFARIFSGRSAVQLAMNLAKLALAGLVTYFATRDRIGDIVALQNQPLADAVPAAGALFAAVAIRLGILLLVLGVIDYAYQRFRHERELRMTPREVKDEMRRLEGDPLQRGRRRQMAATLAAAKVQREVSFADVIIAGGDVAVAIRFDRASMLAPRVLAKGRGAAGREVREAAKRQGIVSVERDDLAAALFAAVAIGREVPSRLFEAVAEVLAYAYELKGKRAN
jgi:flagellar biosynthetic protein FlhB